LKPERISLYAGNPKRKTSRPTALLGAFSEINLIVIKEIDGTSSHLTPLSFLWIGAQSTYKKGFPARSLTTAPGCNALAALRPRPQGAQLPQWLYAVWHFSKKVPWLRAHFHFHG
jgi:hypothetical protein